MSSYPDRNAVGAPAGLIRLLSRLRIELAAVLILALALLGPGIAAPPLIDWDEATYAQVSHEAVDSHHYLDLTWNGQPYLKKPPLLFWMVSASFRAFGESELSARLPSLLMGFGTLAVIYLSACQAAGRTAGACAALVPLTFYFFIARAGRECATDAPLVFFSTLAIYSVLRARLSRVWLALAGVATGLAILAKGLAGFIPLIVAIVATIALPGFSSIGAGGVLVMVVSALIVSAPWYVDQALSAPGFFSVFFGRETLLRVVTHLEGEVHPASATLRTLAIEIRHLWPLMLPALALSMPRPRRALTLRIRKLSPALSLWCLWLIVALAAAFAVQTRLGWYILPALIPLALLAGTLFAAAATAHRSALALAIVASVMLMITVPPRLRAISDALEHERARSRPSLGLALKASHAADAYGGGELFFAGVALPTLVYYSRMRCQFVDVAQLAHVELVGSGVAPEQVRYHDLILIDPVGQAHPVGNLDREWEAQVVRSPAPITPAPRLSGGEPAR